MIERILSRYPSITGLYIILGFYFFIQWVLRITGPGGFELDEAEQIILSQRVQIGYSASPPLYTWLQIIFFKLLGDGIVALSALKQLLLAATYIFIFFAARRLGLTPFKAATASLSLMLIPDFSWESQRDLTHTVLAVMLASATLLSALVLISDRRSIRSYIIFGSLLGLGFLSKWNYAIFAISLILSILIHSPKILLQGKFLLSLSIVISIIFPFFDWVRDNLHIIGVASHKLKIEEVGGGVKDYLI